MIELANALDRLLQLPIIGDPAANLTDPLAAHAELLHPPSSVGHRQHEYPMPFTTCTFRAILSMSYRALQQRAAQQFAGDRQLGDKLVARPNGSIANHSI